MPTVLSVIVPTHDTRDLTLRCLAAVLDAPQLAAADGLELILVDDAQPRRHPDEAAPPPSAGRRAAPRARPRASPAPPTRGLARPRVASSCCSSTATPRSRPAASARLVDAFAAEPRLGDRRRRPVTIRTAAAVERRRRAGASPGCSPWRAACPPCSAACRSTAGAAAARPPRRATAVDWVTGAAMAIRRAAWEAAGPLDEGFRFYAQDLDFCLRARRAGWEVAGAARSSGCSTTTARPSAARRRPGPASTRSCSGATCCAGPASTAARAGRRAPRPALRTGVALRLAGLRLALLGPLVRPGAARPPAARTPGAGARALAALSSPGSLPSSRPRRVESPSAPAPQTTSAPGPDPRSHARTLPLPRPRPRPGGPGAEGALPALGHRLRLDHAPAAADDAGPPGGLQLDLPLQARRYGPTTRSTPSAGHPVLELLQPEHRGLDEQPAGNAPLLRKLPVPKEVFPLATVISGVINLCWRWCRCCSS